MSRFFKITILLINLLVLSACSPLTQALIGGGIAGAIITTGSKEKSIGSTIDDLIISAKIQNKLRKLNYFFMTGVNVYEGVVLLTGSTKNTEDMVNIVKIVWEIDGVKSVINELKVKGGDVSIVDYAKDSLITTKIKAEILLNKEIKFVNFNIETIDKTVYIMGVARSQEELDHLIKIVTKFSAGKLVNHARVASQKAISIENNPKITNSQNDHDLTNKKEVEEKREGKKILLSKKILSNSISIPDSKEFYEATKSTQSVEITNGSKGGNNLKKIQSNVGHAPINPIDENQNIIKRSINGKKFSYRNKSVQEQGQPSNGVRHSPAISTEIVSSAQDNTNIKLENIEENSSQNSISSIGESIQDEKSDKPQEHKAMFVTNIVNAKHDNDQGGDIRSNDEIANEAPQKPQINKDLESSEKNNPESQDEKQELEIANGLIIGEIHD